MALEYIRTKTRLAFASKSEEPVLSEEDELFLNKIVAEENPPALPPRPAKISEDITPPVKDAQIALMDGAQNIALPQTPPEVSEEPDMMDPGARESRPTRSTWSWLRRDSRDTRREHTAAGLSDIAQNLKSADAEPNEDHVVDDKEAKKEEEDMAIVLERLNLAAVNNRVFSISDDTQELLHKFNQVFKDLINGVPTAYDDLEKLLTTGDRQLQKTFNSLPSFLQKLIEKLPETITKGLGPEMMATAAAAGSQQSSANAEKAGKAAGSAAKTGLKIPSLKDLTGKPAALATMLRSIITFLRTRFPAFMGMNVLWSLAMFVLLFVFWYCHKRGKETRLEKERDLTDQEVEKLNSEYRATHPNPTTTADEGAPMDEVKEGIHDTESTTKNAEVGGGEQTSVPVP